MAETTGDLFRSYVRSLRWQVPLALSIVWMVVGTFLLFGLVALVSG